MSDSSRQQISKSQRERYERLRQEQHRRRDELHAFALWLHPTWDETNEDDVAAALAAVDRFIAKRSSHSHSSKAAP